MLVNGQKITIDSFVDSQVTLNEYIVKVNISKALYICIPFYLLRKFLTEGSSLYTWMLISLRTCKVGNEKGDFLATGKSKVHIGKLVNWRESIVPVCPQPHIFL